MRRRVTVILKSGERITMYGKNIHMEVKSVGNKITGLEWTGVTDGENALFLDANEIAAVTQNVEDGGS